MDFEKNDLNKKSREVPVESLRMIEFEDGLIKFGLVSEDGKSMTIISRNKSYYDNQLQEYYDSLEDDDSKRRFREDKKYYYDNTDMIGYANKKIFSVDDKDVEYKFPYVKCYYCDTEDMGSEDEPYYNDYEGDIVNWLTSLHHYRDCDIEYKLSAEHIADEDDYEINDGYGIDVTDITKKLVRTYQLNYADGFRNDNTKKFWDWFRFDGDPNFVDIDSLLDFEKKHNYKLYPEIIKSDNLHKKELRRIEQKKRRLEQEKIKIESEEKRLEEAKSKKIEEQRKQEEVEQKNLSSDAKNLRMQNLINNLKHQKEEIETRENNLLKEFEDIKSAIENIRKEKALKEKQIKSVENIFNGVKDQEYMQKYNASLKFEDFVR